MFNQGRALDSAQGNFELHPTTQPHQVVNALTPMQNINENITVASVPVMAELMLEEGTLCWDVLC